MFFHRLKDKLRDKTRDNVCARLCEIGLKAQIAERGCPEEGISTREASSIGLIQIHGELIRWVNVVRGTGEDRYFYKNIYLVPDPSVRNKGYAKAESLRIKSIPLVGRVLSIRWKGELPDDLIKRMNEDTLLNRNLLGLNEEIRIRSFPQFRCWAIAAAYANYDIIPPSREQWDCYEIIARYLLQPGGK